MSPAATAVSPVVRYTPLSELLSDAHYTGSILAFSVVQFALYFGAIRLFPKTFKTVKQRGWILTASNSLVTTAGSLVFGASVLLHAGPISSAPMMDWLAAQRILAGFFVSYLLGDLFIGTVWYPSEMNPMSGYFHHTLYVFMTTSLLQWNLGGPLCWMFLLEAPTLLLSVAQINKALRNDMLFGAVFFATRIVFHIYAVLHFAFAAFPGSLVWMYPASVLPLHFMWFRGWIAQQQRLYKGRKASKAAAADASKRAAAASSGSTLPIEDKTGAGLAAASGSGAGSIASPASSPAASAKAAAAAAAAKAARPDRRRATTWRHPPAASPVFPHGAGPV
ncbi:hypothetical protein DFJ73DRAFT_836709 [Zopfochytrium polystomum]|nr:hypothetical protein DFJ73DRAFT_836709 [Zopfochytrium polystomum]